MAVDESPILRAAANGDTESLEVCNFRVTDHLCASNKQYQCSWCRMLSQLGMILNSCPQQDVLRCKVARQWQQAWHLACLAPLCECLFSCSIIASERGHTQVVNALLKQNANIQACTRCVRLRSSCLTYTLLLMPA